MYEIIDTRTGTRVGTPYKHRPRARRRADQLDWEYGAYRYQVRPLASTPGSHYHVGEAPPPPPRTTNPRSLTMPYNRNTVSVLIPGTVTGAVTDKWTEREIQTLADGTQYIKWWTRYLRIEPLPVEGKTVYRAVEDVTDRVPPPEVPA